MVLFVLSLIIRFLKIYKKLCNKYSTNTIPACHRDNHDPLSYWRCNARGLKNANDVCIVDPNIAYQDWVKNPDKCEVERYMDASDNCILTEPDHSLSIVRPNCGIRMRMHGIKGGSKEGWEWPFCCSSECCEDIDDNHIQPPIVNVDTNFNEIFDPISFSGETGEFDYSRQPQVRVKVPFWDGEDGYEGGGKGGYEGGGEDGYEGGGKGGYEGGGKGGYEGGGKGGYEGEGGGGYEGGCKDGYEGEGNNQNNLSAGQFIGKFIAFFMNIFRNN